MNVATLDITALSNKGAVLEIKYPKGMFKDGEDKDGKPIKIDISGEPTGWQVTCTGNESSAYREKLIEMKKRMHLNSKPEENKTIYDLEQENIDILSACIVSWRGADENGKPFECNDVNKRRFLEQDWFRKQVQSFVEDQSNFFGKPAVT